jgi:hypothetical protein
LTGENGGGYAEAVKSATDRSLASARRVRQAALFAATLGLVACGLRTDADEEDSGGGGEVTTGETGIDEREGSCDTPFMLPFANITVRGRLAGPGKIRGWCGRSGDDSPDAGPEDSYIVTPTFNVDVVVAIPEADFEPTLRVTKDGCEEDAELLPAICAAPIGDASRHFFAEVGHSYTITVDSPAGTDGRYEMALSYGDPGIPGCPIHPSQINQEHGGFFTWSNDFTTRQGQVDGACGGPGAENMFQLNVSYPGLIDFRVEADDSFEPVLSVRSGCGGVTELQCTSAAQTGSNSLAISQFFDVPGTYYVVVDQGGVAGGSYQLDVFSE